MNTHIQELAARAKASVPQGILGVDKWIEAYNEKFAELIVRECASKVDSSLRDWLHDNSGGTMGDKLKQHFGVEE